MYTQICLDQNRLSAILKNHAEHHNTDNLSFREAAHFKTYGCYLFIFYIFYYNIIIKVLTYFFKEIEYLEILEFCLPLFIKLNLLKKKYILAFKIQPFYYFLIKTILSTPVHSQSAKVAQLLYNEDVSVCRTKMPTHSKMRIVNRCEKNSALFI